MGKKKKKKHKHKRREEIFTGKVEVKQQVCISIDQGGKSIDMHDGKKKKVQLQSTISFPLSDTVEIHKKKKKDKERKRKYSLLIDTNTTNTSVYTIPCSVDKYLTKYKVNNNSDEDSLVKSKKYSSKEKDSIYETENNEKSSEINFEKTVKDNDKNTSFPHEENKYSSKDENSAKSSSSSSSSSPQRNESHNLNATSENIKKKAVPTHVWDDSKKKQFAWDGSNKSDTIEQLLDGGPKVSSWDGSNKSYFYNIKKQSENTQDEWDEEYDKGKVKKKRKLDDDYEKNKSKSNVFQDYQNYKNQNKDNHNDNQDKDKHRSGSKHHNSDHRHHNNSKKRKLYGHGSRFG